MKKIIHILCALIIGITITACNEEITPGVYFEHPDEIIHYIGDNKPIYKDLVSVTYQPGDISLKSLLMYSDAKVQYTTVGSYEITFTVTYQSVKYESTASVKVELKDNGEDEEIIDFEFYYINDLHGAILEDGDSIGLSKISNVVLEAKTLRPNKTIFLSGGDIVQGQILSNWYDGASTIDILNHMQLDAYVVGNHEFDWGFNVVTQYFNGENTLQANFPLLGANVYEKTTNKRHVDVEPYTIIEKAGVKIAVIGTIGYGLESSISYPRIQDYYFTDPVELTGYWAEYVRLEEGADIVVAINHQDASFYNNQVATFTGNKRIDAIFNGHTHYAYVRDTNTSHGVVHTIQSGANGTNLGKVTLTYDRNLGVINSEAVNLNRYNEPKLNQENESIKNLVNSYVEEIEDLYVPILNSGDYYSQNDLTYYLAKMMQIYTNSDIGIHNFGGTRTSISYGEGLSYAKLFQISPFDNTIVTVKVKGSVINQLSGVGVVYRSGLGSINPNTYYKVATNDYIFGNNESFKNGEEIVFTGETLLDVMAEVIRNQKDNGATVWTTNLEIIFDSNLKSFSSFYLPRKEYFM